VLQGSTTPYTPFAAHLLAFPAAFYTYAFACHRTCFWHTMPCSSRQKLPAKTNFLCVKRRKGKKEEKERKRKKKKKKRTGFGSWFRVWL
jgi:hypothetical protein